RVTEAITVGATTSKDVVAPTVIASVTRAGDLVEALVDSLPAATTKVTPAAMALRTAASSVLSAPPPSDMLATAGLTALRATQSMPATTWAVVPEPELFSTRTATIFAFLATPYALPA